jgi:hypothetical protein
MTASHVSTGARRMTGTLEHEAFCLPRTGQKEPRIEIHEAPATPTTGSASPPGRS